MVPVLKWDNSEVDNSCDDAKAHFMELKDRNCWACGWVNWSAIQNYDVGQFENPCYHTELNSNTEFRVVHGSGAGEVCA